MTQVAPSLEAALDYVSRGGTVYVQTATRIWPINQTTVAKFQKAGYEVLKEADGGYRMQTGKRSVFIPRHYLVYEA